jgi:hypothetical protein
MVIRHIGVWSVARLYGGLCAAMGLLFGAVIALFSLVGGMAGAAADPGSGWASGTLGAMFGVGAIIFLALYNLFAGLFGGIEMDVQ